MAPKFEKNDLKNVLGLGILEIFRTRKYIIFGGLLLMFQKSQGQPPGMYQTL